MVIHRVQVRRKDESRWSEGTDKGIEGIADGERKLGATQRRIGEAINARGGTSPDKNDCGSPRRRNTDSNTLTRCTGNISTLWRMFYLIRGQKTESFWLEFLRANAVAGRDRKAMRH